MCNYLSGKQTNHNFVMVRLPRVIKRTMKCARFYRPEPRIGHSFSQQREGGKDERQIVDLGKDKTHRRKIVRQTPLLSV